MRFVAASGFHPNASSSGKSASAWFQPIFYEVRRRTADRGRDLRTSADIHRQIYQAIREHDRARAAHLMNEHLLVAEREQDSEGPDAPVEGS